MMSRNKWLICTSVIAGLATLFTFFVFGSSRAHAYGACEEYGLMAVEDYLTGGCTCMSGYVMGKGYLGETQCVSGTSVCHDKYGYNSRYNSISESCECSYGYAFNNSYGRTQCVSLDSICQDRLGFNSEYDSLSDGCKCKTDYVIEGGRCVDGDQVCRSDHGLFASYNSLKKQCECDDGYTFDDSNQCVKKQNNTYFKLLDVNTDEKNAIIESDYDRVNYLITYGNGCYAGSMNRNVGGLVVVNLGTDFSVDRYDTLVLQDDDETCDIRNVEKTYFDSFEEMIDQQEFISESLGYVEPVFSYSRSNSSQISENSPGSDKSTDVNENTNISDNGADFEEISGSSSILRLNISSTTSNSGKEEEEKKEVRGFFRKIIDRILGWFN